MSIRPIIRFAEFKELSEGHVVLLAADGPTLSDRAKACDPEGVLDRAFGEGGFKGASGKASELLVPAGTNFGRMIVLGTGKADDRKEPDFIKFGGALFSKLKPEQSVSAVMDLPSGPVSPQEIARFVFGAYLRSYVFDQFKTKAGNAAKQADAEDEDKAADKDKKAVDLTILCEDPKAAEEAWAAMKGIADGVLLAREVVDMPANLLGPLEFAEKASALSELGVEVEILDEKRMADLGMGALLGVAQGSVRPPRLVVMRWNGGSESEKPLAFVGKGVVFDSGGISIKPSSGMEEMKGDMGGAAAVIGLMHALASRKAKANVIGAIGLVENMPDANAQRPGDIVTSMSGQTIEVVNTDAEGRLVLADALHYVRDKYAPSFMIDLATLTGAVLIALGNDHAGLFSNNDELADRLFQSGMATEEKVWRLPLTKAYDKLIDSKNADMKNVGGRMAGSITAAQFLQRFVGTTPWAHLDVAGTAFGSPATEISGGWASGYGVRLLDRLVADHYEAGSPKHV